MRRIALAVCLTASISGYRPVSDASHASQATGKIPITTRSEKTRALFLQARSLNETLKLHEAHVLFAQAVAADPSFAMGEYYLAATAPNANDLADHLQKALALAANASPGERLTILGFEARNHADRARALVLAESLAVLYPRDERAHSGLAAIYSAQQSYAEAIAEYEKAIATTNSLVTMTWAASRLRVTTSRPREAKPRRI